MSYVKHEFTENEIIEAINSSSNITEAASKLGLKKGSASRKLLNRKIKTFNINVSHFNGLAWSLGKKIPYRISIEDYLSNKIKVSSSYLKKRLINEKIFEYECQKCKNTIWNDLPIPLQLHHINGNEHDNSLKNLSILCANCHSQTENFCRPKSSIKNKTSNKKCIDCEKLIYPSKGKRCKECGLIRHNRNRYSIEWPNLEELKKMIWKYSLTDLEKKLGVTRVAIKNYCIKHAIEIPPKGFWNKNKKTPN